MHGKFAETDNGVERRPVNLGTISRHVVRHVPISPADRSVIIDILDKFLVVGEERPIDDNGRPLLS